MGPGSRRLGQAFQIPRSIAIGADRVPDTFHRRFLARQEWKVRSKEISRLPLQRCPVPLRGHDLHSGLILEFLLRDHAPPLKEIVLNCSLTPISQEPIIQIPLATNTADTSSVNSLIGTAAKRLTRGITSRRRPKAVGGPCACHHYASHLKSVNSTLSNSMSAFPDKLGSP